MRLIQGYSEAEAAMTASSATLTVVKGRPPTDDGFHTITAAELEQMNLNVRAAVEFIKLVKKLGMDRIHDSMRIEQLIVQTLDAEPKAYAYATSTYSKDNLAQHDEFTQSTLKRVLREYFAKIGMTYEGWN
jgi:hypothetical protein